jgi:hypothetical protein
MENEPARPQLSASRTQFFAISPTKLEPPNASEPRAVEWCVVTTVQRV